MSNVIDLDKRRAPVKEERLFLAAAMCLVCGNKWVAKFPANTAIFKLECPECHETDSFASVLPDSYAQALVGLN